MKARDNPFATDRVLRIRYRLQGETLENLLTRLASLNYRAAIVGPEGSGKTTLLEDLEPHLRARGFRTRPVRSPQFTVHLDEIVLFDGAELLPAWRRLTMRIGAGLIVTLHRPGWLPTLIECRTSPELLSEIVTELTSHGRASLPASRGSAGASPSLVEDCATLYQRHAGNVRACLRELYDAQ